jgi:hypothetical protein
VCLADRPRGACSTQFVACSSCSCSASLSICFVFELWLEEVSDSPQSDADSPRVPGRQSACSPRTVRFSGFATGGSVGFNGQSAAQAGRSAVPVRTICGTLVPVRTLRPSRPDGPPVPGTFVPWFDSSLLLSCFCLCFKESFLRLEVDP